MTHYKHRTPQTAPLRSLAQRQPLRFDHQLQTVAKEAKRARGTGEHAPFSWSQRDRILRRSTSEQVASLRGTGSP
jgi:hypothetical protein